MKIAIASDHGGFNLKKIITDYLSIKNIEFYDFGAHDTTSCDYPIYAKQVAQAILSGNFDRGILVCGTGVGMSIMANRFRGIRAVNTSDTYTAKMSRLHNNSNVLCLGQRVLGEGLALSIVDAWLNAEFEAGRHQRRIDMLDN